MANCLADNFVILGDIEYGARSARVRQFNHGFSTKGDEKFIPFNAENIPELSERNRSICPKLELGEAVCWGLLQ